MQTATIAKKPRKQAVSCRFWAGRTYRGRIKDDHKIENCTTSLIQEAVAKKGIDAEIEYITDMEKIMNYGVMSMPALMIDDKIVSAGKVLKAKDVEKLL